MGNMLEQRDGLPPSQIASYRARGILLSLSGWTSIESGQALRVREDTFRGEARPSCAMDFPGSRGGTRGRMAWNKQLAAS